MRIATFIFPFCLLFVINFTMSAQNEPVLIWQLSDYKLPTEDPVHWMEIFNGETIRAGYYRLKAGAKDDQNPHDFDEVYWVEKGKSKIRIGTNDFDIKKGDVIFVQAKQIHFFHEIKEDLDILVLFSKGPFDPKEKIDQINHIADLQTQRDQTKNIWNDFLKKKSMIFGLYMLPSSTGGDQPLTHQFDEINLVIDGNAIFTSGEKSIPVQSGSLFFVPKNTPHYFKTEKGVDAFILFETRSAEGK